ncbi:MULTISPECIES: AAA family ATPase [Aeromonas]|jgi:predicted ATPase|uniref:AAA family ATPase n=2 Tax=Aeromonadaceae TaxID=84642 RepID=UPI001CD66861|nr:AAA family ATPase [Aeromonas veronii]UBR46736.1 ATP-binding protein [Aeromonas veronii]
MKVCYIWVEEFRNFHNFGLNLSNDFTYSYDSEKHHISRVEKPSLPRDFFHSDITDVTGIIGKNGSGKTNCLELICMILKGGLSRLKTPFIVITQEKDYLTCYSNNRGRTVPWAPTTSFDATQVEYSKQINGIKPIFFSNVSDGREYNFSKDVANLSANKQGRRQNSIKEHLVFINSEKFKYLEIERPKLVSLNLIISDILPSKNSLAQKEHPFTQDQIKKILKIVDNSTPARQIITIINLLLIQKLFHYVSSTDLDKKQKDIFFEKTKAKTIELSISDDNIDELTDQICSEYILLKQINEHNVKNSTKLNGNDISTEISSLKNMSNIKNEIRECDIKSLKTNHKSKLCFNVIFNRESHSVLQWIFEVLNEKQQFECSWLGISSGQKAYINIFSSIYNSLFRSRNSSIICIDEGDLYLHPEWQIQFFEKLNNVLPNLSSGKIQIVISSHSPFLLSDLPNQCLVVLDNDQAKTGFDTLTFGANLYDLYSHAFFLGNRVCSQFALKKIDKLLSLHHIDSEKPLSETEEKNIKDYIGIIGEEIISFHLKRIINNG